MFAFYIIAALKECGSSLFEIKEHFASRDPEKFVATLRAKQQRLAQERAHLEQMQRLLGDMIERIEIVPSLEPGRPTIEHMEEQYLLAVPLDFSRGDEEIAWVEASRKLMESLKAFSSMQRSFDVGAMTTRERFVRKGLEEVNYCYSELSAPVASEYLFVKPASHYATLIHKGSYENLPRSGEHLVDFIRQSGRTITGNAYSIEWPTYFVTEDEDDLVMQIAVQID